MNASITGCVEQGYGYRALNHYGSTREGAWGDIA